MQGIVCISGTNRPDNYTARALAIVVTPYGKAKLVKSSMPHVVAGVSGHPDTGDGERLRTAVAAARRHPRHAQISWQFLCHDQALIENLGTSVLEGKPVALVGWQRVALGDQALDT
jgi:hypothetical protein